MSVQPRFLTLEEALAIHADQVRRYGGDAGVRDMGLLQSALAQAAASFGGESMHRFPSEMAAAYLFHLVSNHAFIDGNKRVGAVASRVFLLMNGMRFDPPEGEFEQLTLAVASGRAGKNEAVAFFERYTGATPSGSA